MQKIVEWDILRDKDGEPIRDNVFQWISLFYMIPILGQFIWLLGWVLAFKSRKVYWVEIK